MTIDDHTGIIWHDALDLGLRGRGWLNEQRELPYDRFPAAMQGLISPELWKLSTYAAGGYVEVRGPLQQLWVRWRLSSENEGADTHFMAAAGHAGIDCYGRDGNGRWQWVGCAAAWNGNASDGALSKTGLDGVDREYRLYLPLMRRVEQLEIGARDPLQAVTPDPRLVIAYYGTSIVHGTGVGRPGLPHAAQLGRALDREVLNLGFNGRARCEMAVAEALTRLNPALYVVDVLPNNGVDELPERLPPFIRCLRAARPHTPILLVGDRVFGDATFAPARGELYKDKNRVLDTIVQGLRNEGLSQLHLVHDPSWYGSDNEGTNDASHPNDLGATRMAAALLPAIRALL